MSNATAPVDFADMEPDDVASRIAQAVHTGSVIRATPYRWPEPRSLPTRQWLLGHWILRGEVTAIIAPGGTGKSTISTALALSLASGRPLLGKMPPRGPQSAWIYNLEDSQEEMERQVSAACLFHSIKPDDCQGRLYIDSGLVQPLCTATEDRDGFVIMEDVFAQIGATIREKGISVIIVDPLVSSHAVRESSNEAIDAIVKRWKRLAQETGCAVVLVHHTKKLGGRAVTAEDGRGAVALRDAARIVLLLNAVSNNDAKDLGITDVVLRRSLVRLDTGKANRTPSDAPTWIKLESQCLDNGTGSEAADYVGVACLWEKPNVFHGLSRLHLHQIQLSVAAGQWKDSVLAKDWAGNMVAQVVGLSLTNEMSRIKALLAELKRNGALGVEKRRVNGKDVPFLIVGKGFDPNQLDFLPHSENCGENTAETAADDPS